MIVANLWASVVARHQSEVLDALGGVEDFTYVTGMDSDVAGTTAEEDLLARAHDALGSELNRVMAWVNTSRPVSADR